MNIFTQKLCELLKLKMQPVLLETVNFYIQNYHIDATCWLLNYIIEKVPDLSENVI